MTKKFAVAVAALTFLLAALPASAGWRVQEVDPEFPEEATTYWFQGGKARLEGALEGLAVIVDVKEGTGWLVDEAAKRYAGGKLDELAEELRRIENEGLPDDEEFLDDDEEGAGLEQGKVEVKSLGAAEKILGHDTVRFQVFVDGEMLEELWMAPKVAVEREVDPAAFTNAVQRMLGGGTGMDQGYENDPAYVKASSTGFPMRQVLYFVGEKSTLEVTAAEEKVFPDALFAVPPGLEKVGYVELLVGEDPQ